MDNPSPSLIFDIQSGMMKRIVKGLNTNFLSHLITAANSLLLVPFYIRGWGANGYGKWILLTAFISYFVLLDLGGQSYIGNLLAKAYTCGDKIEFRRKLSEGVSFYVLLSLVILFIFIIYLLLPLASLPGHRMPLSLEERIILLLVGINLLQSIPAGVYVSAYRSSGLLARSLMVGNITRGSLLLLSAIILWFSFPPIMMAACILVIGIGGTCYVAFDIKWQVLDNHQIKLSLANARLGKAYLRGSLYFWLLSLAYSINFQGVILVLSSYQSNSVVALYNTHRTAAGLVNYIYNLMLTPLWPEFTFLYAQGKQEELKKVLLLVVKVVVLLSGITAIALVWIIPIIYPIWTGNRLDLNSNLLLILLVQGVLASGWNASCWSLLASNKHKPLAAWALLNAILTIPLSVIGAIHFGVVGVATATLTGDILCGLLVYPALGAKALDMPIRKMYLTITRPIVALFIPIGGLMLLSTMVQGLTFLFTGFLVLVVCGGISILFTFGMDEFAWLRSKLLVRGGLT